MKNVIVIGAGGHGHVIADIIRAAGDRFCGYLDDAPHSDALGKVTDCERFAETHEFVIGIGNAAVREQISRKELNWYTAIHPTAVISASAQIGAGTVIMANAVVNARAVVGKHCIINTSAIVEHDNVIADYSHVSVGAKLGGTVSVGRSSWIGIGSTVKNNIRICEDCMVGAGAVVVKNIDVPGVYIGIPAYLKTSR